jgi:hypothetical protein
MGFVDATFSYMVNMMTDVVLDIPSLYAINASVGFIEDSDHVSYGLHH